MDYLLYSYQRRPKLIEGLLIAGLYHWPTAMGGKVGALPLEELPGQFDAVHINHTSGSLGLLTEISEACRGSKTTRRALGYYT